jgi:hydroxymethylglutaryl-CoA reductase
MQKNQIIQGFSRLSPEEKRRCVSGFLEDPSKAIKVFSSFFHPDHTIQQTLSEFSENTLTNFALPYSVAPNFLINGEIFLIPMVIEESSVVAAASSAARFWSERGGFRAKVHGTEKNGQLHFRYKGDPSALSGAMPSLEKFLRQRVAGMAANMEKRGGGITSISLKDFPDIEKGYFQLFVGFETVDAMGANFINSVLEEFGAGLEEFLENEPGFDKGDYEPVMAILSNYSPLCTVEVYVECPVEDLGRVGGIPAGEFASRFLLGVRIAEMDIHRATTHNKGIMNGVDAVILATGNDFRAIEAGAHAWAARSGQYRSLSRAKVENGLFRFSLEMPMALGTTGGLTRLHPLAALSLELLGNPGARQLMMIAAAAGLANNFAAVRSLVTTGIQAGHMRMHLPNMLMQLNASPEERARAEMHFADKKPSHRAVAEFIQSMREGKTPAT